MTRQPKNRVRVLLFVCVLLAGATAGAAPPAPDNILVYRLLGTDMAAVPPGDMDEAMPLPDELIIDPGDYLFEGRAYSVREPGLYRFVRVMKKNEQRIVRSENVHDMISAMAWIHSHGKADDVITTSGLVGVAKSRKIVTTCGPIAAFAVTLLKNEELDARAVSSLAGPPYNSYDNGHTLFEVYRTDLGKWVLYDVDNNVYFTRRGVPLSLPEFVASVPTNDYELVDLAGDARTALGAPKTDDFTFYFEYVLATHRALRRWYQHVMQIPMYHGGDGLYYFSAEGPLRAAAESYSPSYRYLPPEEFSERFHGPPPPKPATASGENHVVYHMGSSGAETVRGRPAQRGEEKLPAKLVIPPDDYVFGGVTYSLRGEGLYRLLDIGKRNEQRIVFSSNVDSLLGAVAWLHTTGSSDEGMAPKDIEHIARTRKVFLGNESITTFALEFLSRRGICARRVGMLALPPYNSYDDGQMLLEVFHPDLQRWVLYDVNRNVTFSSRGVPLDLRGVVRALAEGRCEIVRLASDVTDELGNRAATAYDFSLYAETINSTPERLLDRYRRIGRVGLIESDGAYYFADPANAAAVEAYSATYKALAPDRWQAQFYGAAPNCSRATTVAGGADGTK